ALQAQQDEFLKLARAAAPGLVQRGGGPDCIEVRDLGRGDIVLHLLVDCRDAMGANLVNAMAEAIGPYAAELSGGCLGLRILSNLCDRRRVRTTCRVHARELLLSRSGSGTSSLPPAPELNGSEIVDLIVEASRFAEIDPYRAA